MDAVFKNAIQKRIQSNVKITLKKKLNNWSVYSKPLNLRKTSYNKQQKTSFTQLWSE